MWFVWSLVACVGVGLDEVSTSSAPGHVSLVPEGDINFGESSPVGRPLSLTLNVVSDGLGPTRVLGVYLETDSPDVYYLGALPFPRDMEPDTELPVEVNFLPANAGNFFALLVVVSTDQEDIERNVVGSGCEDAEGDGLC